MKRQAGVPSQGRQLKRGQRRCRPVPKKPLSAYNVFFQQERKLLIERHKEGQCQPDFDENLELAYEKKGRDRQKDAVFQAASRTLANRWKKLSPKERLPFEKVAREEARKYEVLMQHFESERLSEMLDYERSKPRNAMTGSNTVANYAVASPLAGDTGQYAQAAAAAAASTPPPWAESQASPGEFSISSAGPIVSEPGREDSSIQNFWGTGHVLLNFGSPLFECQVAPSPALASGDLSRSEHLHRIAANLGPSAFDAALLNLVGSPRRSSEGGVTIDQNLALLAAIQHGPLPPQPHLSPASTNFSTTSDVLATHGFQTTLNALTNTSFPNTGSTRDDLLMQHVASLFPRTAATAGVLDPVLHILLRLTQNAGLPSVNSAPTEAYMDASLVQLTTIAQYLASHGQSTDKTDAPDIG